MCELNENEILYSKLIYKSRFIELDENEQKEVGYLNEVLGLVTCDTCKGQGFFISPSMLGYGIEEGACVKCQGTGMLNISENLIKELLGNI